VPPTCRRTFLSRSGSFPISPFSSSVASSGTSLARAFSIWLGSSSSSVPATRTSMSVTTRTSISRFGLLSPSSTLVPLLFGVVTGLSVGSLPEVTGARAAAGFTFLRTFLSRSGAGALPVSLSRPRPAALSLSLSRSGLGGLDGLDASGLESRCLRRVFSALGVPSALGGSSGGGGGTVCLGREASPGPGPGPGPG